MPAIVIPPFPQASGGIGSGNASLVAGGITYRGFIGLQLQALGRVSTSIWGLAEGDVVWKCPTSLVYTLSPVVGIRHPVLPYMFMEKVDIDLDAAYSTITGHFVGAYPGAISTYEYQPSFSESPIETNPNWSAIVRAAGAGNVKYNTDGSFASFLNGAGDHLAGLTSYLVSQGFYVESSVSDNPPDCSTDGQIEDPDGSPPEVNGNWLRAPTFYQQRAIIYDIRRSWKASGGLPYPNSVYGG